MKKLSEMFDDLTILEELIERLEPGQRIQITSTERLHRALETSARTLRGQIKNKYATALAQRSFRLPESRIKPENTRFRLKREKESEHFYQKLEDYFNG